MIDARCRVTVVGAEKRVDIAIPAQAPIAEYNDMLARLCGQPTDDALPPVWSLAPVGLPPFPLTTSLAAEGVADGAVLYLRDTLEAEEHEPVVQDVWELVADHARTSGARAWDRAAMARAALFGGAFWLVAAIGRLGFAGRDRAAVAVVGGVFLLALTALTRLLRGHRRVLPARLRGVLGAAIVAGAGVVAALALGEPRPDLIHVAYLLVGLVCGFVLALVAVPGVLLGAFAVLTALAGALLAVVAGLHASSESIAATVVVVGVLFLAVAPRVAAMLVAASWLSLSEPVPEPDADPESLNARINLSHRVLQLLILVTSAAVGCGLLVLTRHGDPFAVAVAAVATLILFLRTVTFELAADAVPAVVAAAAGLFGLVTLLLPAGAGAAVLLLIGVAVMAVGLPLLFWGGSAARAKSGPSGPLLTIGQIILPALLLGVYGLYTMLWSLGH